MLGSLALSLLLCAGNAHAAALGPLPGAGSGGLQARQDLPKMLYRGETRSPEELKKLGGIPTEFSGPTTSDSYSLDFHHRGTGGVRSAYTSTSKAFAPSVAFAVGKVVGADASDGWVYRIHPTPNMIDMDNSGFQLTYSTEEEFSAMGGIRWDQIEAWIFLSKNITDGYMGSYRKDWKQFEGFAKEFPDMKWTENGDYDRKYDQFSPSPGQPQLAGDDANLDKFKEKTLEQHAVEFMTKNGPAVGWNGALPMDVLAAAEQKPEGDGPETLPFIGVEKLSSICFPGQVEKCLGTQKYCETRAWTAQGEKKQYSSTEECLADRGPEPKR